MAEQKRRRVPDETPNGTRIFRKTILFGLCLLALAAPAAQLYAERYGPPSPWEQHRITYFNASGWRLSLKAAARQWNRLDFGVRFVAVDDRAIADLVIVDRRDLRCADCVGRANVVGHGLQRARVYLLPPRGGSEPAGAINDLYVRTIVHELGHVLGLRHADARCAAMHSGDRFCPLDPRLLADKRLLSCGPYRADLDQLAELYPIASIARPRPRSLCRERRPDLPDPIPSNYGK